jgi:hypothetical protein
MKLIISKIYNSITHWVSMILKLFCILGRLIMLALYKWIFFYIFQNIYFIYFLVFKILKQNCQCDIHIKSPECAFTHKQQLACQVVEKTRNAIQRRQNIIIRKKRKNIIFSQKQNVKASEYCVFKCSTINLSVYNRVATRYTNKIRSKFFYFYWC